MPGRLPRPFKGRVIRLHPPQIDADQVTFNVEHGPREGDFAIDLCSTGAPVAVRRADLMVKLLYMAAEHGWRLTIQPKVEPPYDGPISVENVYVEV